MTTGRPLSRPLLRWHGGKWRLAPWIIGHFPPHRVYVEPYGGAASVLLQKPRSHGEVWNDLDAGVHNLMKVLREGHAAELAQQLSLTPFSRREFELSYLPADDPVEAARRMVVRCFMGFGSSASNPKRRTGFRSNSMRSGTIPAVEWTNYPFALLDLAERLMGVVIESRPAIEVMAQHDSLDTLHYLDPPYMFETRTDRRADYAHEMSDEQHAELLEYVSGLKGMVMISGYPCPLYEEKLASWVCRKRRHLADQAAERTECLWINGNASDRLGVGPLFSGESDS
jgi:DNA adenine methylase